MKKIVQKVRASSLGDTLAFWKKFPFWGAKAAPQIDKRVFVFLHDVMALFVAMQISIWFVLRDDMHLLEAGFVFKQSIVFALIASGFFLWFQTYKGIWRYVSWRQAALLIGLLGFASLIFFPLITKAHMQPINIPSMTVYVNWGVASLLLIGSRIFYRIFHERWTVMDDSTLADSPMARVILVGAGQGAKTFMRHLKRQKTELYDVLCAVETNPRVDGAVEGVDVLGSLADLPDLIENFNTEGIHPHSLVFTDRDYLGLKARQLIKNLSALKVGFFKVCEHTAAVVPLTIEDAFYERTEDGGLEAFDKKKVLIYGASSPLGQELTSVLLRSPCSEIIIWDQKTTDLVALKDMLDQEGGAKKVTLLSKNTVDEAQLETVLRSQQVDVALNLKAFAALESERHDASLSFEVYLEENERFAQACLRAGVGHYLFVTQEAPHGVLATQLTSLATQLLRDFCKKTKASYAAINLPYILSARDVYFQGRYRHPIYQAQLPVVSCGYGAFMLLRIAAAIMSKKAWEGAQSVSMESMTYDGLAEVYSTLNHHAVKPTYTLQPARPAGGKVTAADVKSIQGAAESFDFPRALEMIAGL